MNNNVNLLLGMIVNGDINVVKSVANGDAKLEPSGVLNW